MPFGHEVHELTRIIDAVLCGLLLKFINEYSKK
jgi:hypothetical protein